MEKHALQADKIISENGTTIEEAWESKLCASSSSSQDAITCSGDSGAPLMIELNELILGKMTVKYSLVGLVSAGPKDCSNEKLPTIFTNVFSYTDWVKNTIDETEYTNAGRYCTIDNDEQCAVCDNAYKLTGYRCEQEFTQNQMNSLYSFFDDTFCADDCFSYMKIIVDPESDPVKCLDKDGVEVTPQNLNDNFLGEYKTCKCDNGNPALRCKNEVEQFCDKDGCFQNYLYNATGKSCDLQVGNIMSLTCEKTQHYVKEKSACEPNDCYCTYGEVVNKCYDHGFHSCNASKCRSDAKPLQHG